MGRKAIGRSRRFEIFKRDGFSCVYCGTTPPEAVLEVDHVVAVANGGGDDDHNLVTACFDCNRGKRARPIDVVPQSMAERASLIEEREAQVLAYHEILQAARDRAEADCWTIAGMFMATFSDSTISRDYFASIGRSLKLLDVFDAMEAMDLATSKGPSRRRTFLYFCRVCWNMINAPQEP